MSGRSDKSYPRRQESVTGGRVETWENVVGLLPGWGAVSLGLTGSPSQRGCWNHSSPGGEDAQKALRWTWTPVVFSVPEGASLILVWLFIIRVDFLRGVLFAFSSKLAMRGLLVSLQSLLTGCRLSLLRKRAPGVPVTRVLVPGPGFPQLRTAERASVPPETRVSNHRLRARISVFVNKVLSEPNTVHLFLCCLQPLSLYNSTVESWDPDVPAWACKA